MEKYINRFCKVCASSPAFFFLDYESTTKQGKKFIERTFFRDIVHCANPGCPQSQQMVATRLWNKLNTPDYLCRRYADAGLPVPTKVKTKITKRDFLNPNRDKTPKVEIPENIASKLKNNELADWVKKEVDRLKEANQRIVIDVLDEDCIYEGKYLETHTNIWE